MARTKGGLGLAVSDPVAGVRVGALAVVNALGDVVERDGTIIAGTRAAAGFAGSRSLLRAAGSNLDPTNTTLVAVVTDARLDKPALNRLAAQSHDGLALAISPVHTSYDGDVAFALSTGEAPAHPDVLALLAVEVVAEAIRRAVREATSLLGVPAIRDIAWT
jgi:L-aminopeptidase/D-esterase-like protein